MDERFRVFFSEAIVPKNRSEREYLYGKDVTISQISAVKELIPAHIKLRPDAEYFLILNVISILINPLRAVTGSRGTDTVLDRPMPFTESDRSETIRDVIRYDLEMICREAAVRAERMEKPEISSTIIVEVLGAMVRELRSSSFQIWGARD